MGLAVLCIQTAVFWLVMVAGQARAGTLSIVAEGDVYHHVRLSKDGTALTYVERTERGETLRRRRLKDQGVQDVADWPSTMMGYQVSADGSSYLLFERPDGGRPVLLYVPSPAAPPRLIDLQETIAGFGEESGDAFVVLTQDRSANLHVQRVDFGSGYLAIGAELGRSRDVGFDGRGLLRAIRQPDGAWRGLNTAMGPGYVPAGSDSVVSASNNGRYLWFRSMDEQGFRILKRIDLRGDQPVRVERMTEADITWTTINPTTGEVDAYASTKAAPYWVASSLLAPELQALTSSLRAFPYIVSRSQDDRVWLIASMSAREPPRYYIYHRSSGELTYMFAARPSERDGPMPETMVHWLDGGDGVRLQVLVSPPSHTCRVTACPFVVKLHGGPHRQDTSTFDPETYWLQSLGFWVLRVNFRGSTGFGDQFAHASNREWGGKVIDDIAIAVDWFTRRYHVNRTAGISMGGSFGGFAALALAAKRPDTVACSASLNGGGDLEAFAQLLPQRLPGMATDIHTEVGDVHIAEEATSIRAQSPMTHVARIQARMLVEYGDKDTTSVMEESSNFALAARGTGKSALEAIYRGEGHELAAPPARAYHYELLRHFLHTCVDARLAEPLPSPPPNVSIIGNSARILQEGPP
ncbi:prolyl oligopeptidase family serine peptidase [Dyella sp. EPa41]|uniref:alpha/beta hydrolase family protein n=1 Tax=Dyella sp. EPa41 TaxID=1561194 RepID=UPI0019162388|nr:prolyl oligopeptidase family serine peptidase [Dyella sp. EPa41]